jgi:hypothetical protein
MALVQSVSIDAVLLTEEFRSSSEPCISKYGRSFLFEAKTAE